MDKALKEFVRLINSGFGVEVVNENDMIFVFPADRISINQRTFEPRRRSHT